MKEYVRAVRQIEKVLLDLGALELWIQRTVNSTVDLEPPEQMALCRLSDAITEAVDVLRNSCQTPFKQ